MATDNNGEIMVYVQWPFQDPIDWRYLPYIRPTFQAYVREYPHKIWPYMVQYLQFRILEFPLIRILIMEDRTGQYGMGLCKNGGSPIY